MKLKRILAFVVSLAMVLSVVPAFSLTASAAEEVVLFDAANVPITNVNTDTGDVALSEGSWTGDANGVCFNTRWNNGTWDTSDYFTPVALMFFRTGTRGNGSAENRTATFANANASAGANKITISFTYGIQNASDCYQTWYFRDIDGNNFARFYADKNTGNGTASVGLNTQTTFISSGGSLPIRGEVFSIVATKGETNWSVEYYQGETLLGTDTVAAINGFGSIQANIAQWNTQYAAAGMQGLKITYEMPDTAVDVTATYLVGGTEVNTVTKKYDSATEEGAAFDAYYYSAGNGTNVIYKADAQTLAESTTIEMTVAENTGTYAIGDQVEYNGTKYDVVSANLVPNGDFALGTLGWYASDGNPAGTTFTTNAANGTITTSENTGAAGASSLWRAWATEAGKTYLFTFDASAATGYFVVSEKDDLGATSDGTKVGEATVAGTNTIVYTATKPYVQINFRWIAGKTMGNFGLYEIEEAATSVSVTATYTVDGTEVNSVTKAYDSAKETGAVFDAYYYSTNGTNTLYKAAAQTLAESATIEMTAVEPWNGYAIDESVVAGDNLPYIIKSANLIANGNFAEGINGWYAADGNAAKEANFTVNAANGSVFVVGNGGSGSEYTLQRSWAIESGKTYIFVYTQDRTDTNMKWQRFSLGNTFASNNDAMLLGAGANDVETGQSVVLGTNIVAFTNTEGYQYANFVAAWSQGTTLSNFGLYEAELDTANVAETTVKFVNSADNTELQASATVKGHIGGVIDLTDAALVPEVIKYNDNYYTKDSTNPVSYVVLGNTDTVTVTYTLDPVASFTLPAVTVIEGNSPVLATTVKGSTENTGTEVEITNVVWDDCSGLTAGTHTVNGTATVGDKTVNGTVEVTVLPMSFAPGDLAETNNGTITFPVKVYGDFYVEFDFTATNLDNEWIYIGADGALWASGQISLGFDNAGNGYFRAQPADQTDIQFETGKTYRFLVHGNVDTDTYSLTVYDTVTKAAIFTCSDYAFRTASDYVNTIVATSNGEGGSATLSNVKVYKEGVAPSTITFEYMCGDEVVGSVSQTSYTTLTSSIAAGTYTAENGIKYATDAVSFTVTDTEHTIPVKAVKLEEVTVNYVYNEEIVNTATLYAAIGSEATNKAHVIATAAAVYNAPEFKATVAEADPTYTVDVAVMENAAMATSTLTYNATTGAAMAYPTDRVESLAGKMDAMLSVSWGDDRYGEMLFDVTTADNEGFASASLTLTPGDIMGGQANTFDIYAVPVSSYNGAVDYSTLTPVGSGTFGAVDAPVNVALNLDGYDASEGLMLVYKMTGGLVGVYGTSFIEAPYLTYDVRERATATFNYVCEGVTVGTITVDSFVGNTESLASGYYEAEDGSKYFVDAVSVLLEAGSDNTAAVNARKIEKVTVNYTIGGEVKKTAVFEGFAGDAVITPAVYVNVDKAVYYYEAKEYTFVAGGSEFEVELTLLEGAIYASNTEVFNSTANAVITYPEGDNRNAAFFGTDAMFSASWGDVRYGEMLFDVTVPDGDVINSAQLTLTPGDWMSGGYTYSFDIYAADPADYGEYIALDELTVVGSGRFVQNEAPVTVDLDLSRYDEFKEKSQVMLIYKMTSGLVGTYGASHGDNAPRLMYTTGELGARVEVSDEFVAEYAKGTLSDFDAVNPPVTIPEGSNGYLDINTAWEGISGTSSADGNSHLDVYAASINEPIIRVVSDLAAATGDDSAPSVVTTPGYGEGSEYVLFSFNPEVGTAPWTDIGLRDLDGKLITALRINNSDTDTVCPMWGHAGTGSPYRTYFSENTYSINPAGEAKATVTDLVSQVDVLMRNFDPDKDVAGDEYYTAAFSVDGNVFAVATYPGNFNGLKDIEMTCAGATTNQYGGIAAIKIYSGNEPRVIGSITANYIYNDEVVHTVTKYYDKYALEAGEVASLEFPEFYYSALGSSLLYKVPAQTLTEDTDIQVVQYHPTTNVVLTLIHNWSHDNLRPSDLYTNEETGLTYMIATRNLIPNGNFEHGNAAWYDGTLEELSEVEFVPNPENETMIIRANGTTTSEYGLYNAWAIEKGETYLFTYKATGLNETYAGITQTDVVDPVSYDPTVAVPLVNGENQLVFEAESDFLKLNIGWSKDAEIGSFGLYKLEIIKTGDIHRTIIQGNSPKLPDYVAPEEDGVVHKITWDENAVNSLQIGENVITGTCEEGHTVTATVMVYPETFTVADYTSFNGQHGLTSNNGNVKFEHPVTGKFAVEMDVTVEEYGDLWIILNDSAKTNDTSFFGADQILISPSYFGGEVYPQDGNKDGTRDDLTQLMVAGRNKAYRLLIRGNCELGNYTVTITTPEGVTRTVAKYGFRTMTDKIDSIAMFTNSDGMGKFKATNIKVYDVDPIEVSAALRVEGEEDNHLATMNIGEYFYGEEVTIPAGKFYLSYHDETVADYNNDATADNVAHIVKITEEQSFTVQPSHSETPQAVYVQMHKKNAVLYDTYATTNSDELKVAENLLFIGSNDVSNANDYDADDNATTNANGYMGAPRIPLLTFNVPEFNEGEVVVLNLYAYEANQNMGIGKTMKLAAGTADVVVDENTTYNPDEIANVEDIFWSDSTITQSAETLSEGRYIVQDGTRRVAIDVTDLVVKAKAEGKTTITFALYAPKAGAYVMNREATTYGAIHQGDYAAFLEVENDTYTATVNGASLVTKGGSKVQLVEDGSATVYIRNDGTMRMYTETADHVVFTETESGKVYNIETENGKRLTTLTGDEITDDGIYMPLTLGVDMVDGAQVRIGEGVDENGNFLGGSGLRFITVVNASDTLASLALNDESMEIGVKLTAEGSTAELYVPAEKWQNDGEVFTTALTNLNESNYNRNYTAVPYIKCIDGIDGTELEYTNAPVTRSIYYVSAGLLTKGYDTEGDSNGTVTDGSYADKDGNETDYSSMPQILVDVLNAYVNKTGVRLTLSDSALTARTEGNGAYTGEAFFTVGETTFEDGKYTVTLTAVGQSVINTEIFNTYVRINNNNSKVSPVTTITDNGDGTYTIVFDYSNM